MVRILGERDNKKYVFRKIDLLGNLPGRSFLLWDKNVKFNTTQIKQL
ncbi:hypothetical protein A33Q_4405 [Indibacter alkaliphilus LW1]|uniref:Uncharacterized protein n=1 Tax=Indibacter alkaliphilus (strain CCUG 57479 / KCTC 22604 / LW1) TaxID=1189612 RepID=S2CYS9_INDAL|nr:hypothetical protein A33Q_4405 [Indibacter alkaliphilus LW1]